MGFWTDTTGATPAQHSTITLWKITQTKNFWKINTFAHICTVDGHQQASDLFFVRGVWVRQRLLWRWHFPSSSDSSSCHIVRDSTKERPFCLVTTILRNVNLAEYVCSVHSARSGAKSTPDWEGTVRDRPLPTLPQSPSIPEQLSPSFASRHQYISIFVNGAKISFTFHNFTFQQTFTLSTFHPPSPPVQVSNFYFLSEYVCTKGKGNKSGQNNNQYKTNHFNVYKTRYIGDHTG